MSQDTLIPRSDYIHNCVGPDNRKRDEIGTLWRCPTCRKWWRCRMNKFTDPHPIIRTSAGRDYWQRLPWWRFRAWAAISRFEREEDR